MAEDRYRLAPVRDARARHEQVRRGHLAAAAGEARATAAALEAARGRTATARAALAAASSARDGLIAAGATQPRLAIAERYVERRRRDLVGGLGEELRAETADTATRGAIDAARLTLARARVDREVIERHFATWREARRKLADRRED